MRWTMREKERLRETQRRETKRWWEQAADGEKRFGLVYCLRRHLDLVWFTASGAILI